MHLAPNIGRKVSDLIIEKQTLTPTTMNIFETSLGALLIRTNTISNVKAELKNRYSDDCLTLLVTVKIFHKGSSGKLRHMAATPTHVS